MSNKTTKLPIALSSVAEPVNETPEIFHRTLADLGCELVGTDALNPADLDGNLEYSSFRGPHFGAFSVLARRKV